MILVGNQRSGARNLALHLRSKENDHVEVYQVRGFACTDLMGAFTESEALSKGTRCKQHLFSLSLNPPEGKSVMVEEFEKAIDRAEAKLGLQGQSRAIVFHEKEGRRHAHAVWSRIDSNKMKAVPLPHYKRKLNTLSKQLYKDHNWRLPAGYIDKQLTDDKNFIFEDWQQAKRSEKDPREIKQVFQAAWQVAHKTDDPAQTFSDNLKQHGYELAQGNRRAVVAVDAYGEIYSVPRQLGIKTKEVKAVLGDDLTRLPAADILKAERQQVQDAQLFTFKEAALTKAAEEKQAFKDTLTALIQKQRQERAALKNHHVQRQADEAKIRQSRFRKGVKGLWDRLRGEHARMAKQNKAEAELARQRDRTEKEQLIRKHLWERQQLRKERGLVVTRLKTLNQQKWKKQKALSVRKEHEMNHHRRSGMRKNL